MLKVFISEHDADYHGAYCGEVQKLFNTLEEAEQWCRDNSERPYFYIVDRALDVDTNKIVYN